MVGVCVCVCACYNWLVLVFGGRTGCFSAQHCQRVLEVVRVWAFGAMCLPASHMAPLGWVAVRWLWLWCRLCVVWGGLVEIVSWECWVESLAGVLPRSRAHSGCNGLAVKRTGMRGGWGGSGRGGGGGGGGGVGGGGSGGVGAPGGVGRGWRVQTNAGLTVLQPPVAARFGI